jgi:hypothetical protein
MLSNTLLRNRLSQALILFRNSQQVRTFGLLDRLTQFVSRAGAPTSQDAQKAEAFKFQMDFMLDDARSTYTLADHFTLLQKLAEKSGATGWRKMLLTDAQKSELEEHLVDLKIADLLSPEELKFAQFSSTSTSSSSLTSHSLFEATAKAKLASKLGIAIPRVNKFIEGYRQAASINHWLRGRRAAGKALPNTLEEYAHAMVADKVGHSKEAQKKQMGKLKHHHSMVRKI